MTAVIRVRALLVLLFSLVLAGCGDKPQPLLMTSGDNYPDNLSQWQVLSFSGSHLELAEGIVPYTLNTPLFTDYASKLRTLWVPPGKQATVVDGEIEYPVGTIISKTFYYPVAEAAEGTVLKASEGDKSLFSSEDGLPRDKVKLIETRLLIHQENGWVALPYVWNQQQTEAVLEWAGDYKRLTVTDIDGNPEQTSFTYIIPDANQCAGCHAEEESRQAVKPLGPKIRHLNRDFTYSSGTENQLAYLMNAGLLTGLDDINGVPQNALWPNARENETLEHQAKSYLDANCSHCHNPNGAARTSGLFLTIDTPLDENYGFCKRPIAAGKGAGNRPVDIMPGHADQSILVYRIESVEPGAMMPELGRSLSHNQGVELITNWINGMSTDDKPCVAGGYVL
ncbi:SO2930 family diheme c-type cytochrome [Endozoicomonas ascidiicola]|uniref:SO2930 family diheme c-type cytochrome n=1 Tax=Endozoicomonas ascidiicola TaxID=1698521 RepID=UPI00082F09C1|nr:SO2930 family diheme c-type cytochrome [Endozoicomonas ascidiicola]